MSESSGGGGAGKSRAAPDFRSIPWPLPAVDMEGCLDLLVELLEIPSPSGMTDALMDRVERELRGLGLESRRTPKGALLWTLPGRSDAQKAVAAHVDTLGAMVKEITGDGRLRLSPIGGWDWETVEGAECLVHLADGETLGGTVVNIRQSVHVFSREARERARRDPSAYRVRLDIASRSAMDTKAAGVAVGDFVSFESGARLTPTGYVKGRHLDDKAAVAVALAVTRAFIEAGEQPECTTHFFLSNYEEVGHGAANGIPGGVVELLCIDMAAVGEGQASDEHSVTLCVKDAGGPYDPVMRSGLSRLASDLSLDLKLDIYANYTSDATAAWRAGSAFRAALIGPGVDSSHGYERTHRDALEATAMLLGAYLTEPPFA